MPARVNRRGENYVSPLELICLTSEGACLASLHPPLPPPPPLLSIRGLVTAEVNDTANDAAIVGDAEGDLGSH